MGRSNFEKFTETLTTLFPVWVRPLCCRTHACCLLPISTQIVLLQADVNTACGELSIPCSGVPGRSCGHWQALCAALVQE